MRFGQLPETGVDRLLADGRLAPEPVEVGADVGGRVVEPLALEAEAPDVEPGRGDADLLGQREEGQHERHDDGARGRARAGSSAGRPGTRRGRAGDRASGASRDPRGARGERGSPIVRGRAPS